VANTFELLKLAFMKKLLLIVLVLISLQSFGQGIFSRLSFGIKGGGNYSNFYNAGFKTEGLAGFHAGMTINLKLTGHLSIQEDILYSTQGAKIKDGSFSKEDLKLSYMSLPILLKYRSMFGLYVEAGPQFNMLISDAKGTGLGDFAEKIDAGGAAGFGYEFTRGPVKGLGIGARYYMGLTKVGKFTTSNVNPDFKNGIMQASIFYTF